MARAAGLGAMAGWIPAARLHLIDRTLEQFPIAQQFMNALRILGRQAIQDLALTAGGVSRRSGTLRAAHATTRSSHKAFLRFTLLLITDAIRNVQ
jgi:hypothetical protein